MGLLGRLNCFSSKARNRKRRHRHRLSDNNNNNNNTPDDGGGGGVHKHLLPTSPSPSSSRKSSRKTTLPRTKLCSDIVSGSTSSDTMSSSRMPRAVAVSTDTPKADPNSTSLSPSLVASSSQKQHSTHHYLASDDNSIPTIDSDYNKINSGNWSLSDAGGTLGSQQQSLMSNFTSAFGGAWPMTPLSPFGQSSSVTEDYIEEQERPRPRRHHDYYGSLAAGTINNHGAQKLPSPLQSKNDETIVIYAPPGLLGVVIDTPFSGSPKVHAIKDSCPIRNDIYVGDHLVAVDDVDVRQMNATEVSQLISKKSAQQHRKLTLVRVVLVLDGMGWCRGVDLFCITLDRVEFGRTSSVNM